MSGRFLRFTGRLGYSGVLLLLFVASGYPYNGKNRDSLARQPEILEAIPSIER